MLVYASTGLLYWFILVYFLGNKALLATKYDGEMSFVGVLSAVGL